eukprot:15956928-Heterocapsa_arctica.AAC.1
MLGDVDDCLQLRSVGSLDLSRQGGGEIGVVVVTEPDAVCRSTHGKVSGKDSRTICVYLGPR